MCDAAVRGIVLNFYDVTEKKLADDEVIYLNRLYSFISHICQVIVRTKDEDTLLNEACHIAVTYGNFELAWIGKLADDQKLELAAHCNATDDDLELLNNFFYDNNGPIATLLQTGDAYIINDYSKQPSGSFWKRYADAKGFQSAISLPVRRSGKICFVLNLFSAKKMFFQRQEISLVSEAAENLSFALEFLEQNRQQKIAAAKLKHKELKLKQAQALAHIGSWELDFVGGIAIWSDEHCRIYGLTPEENIQSFESWLSFIHPDDVAYVKECLEAGKETLTSSFFTHRIVRRDGKIRHMHSENHFEINPEGVVVGAYGIAQDITGRVIAEEKLVSANRLYAFISQVNKAITYASNKEVLFDEVCRISVETGKFALAWIGEIDEEAGEIQLTAQYNAVPGDLEIFKRLRYSKNGLIANMLQNGHYHLTNDFAKEQADSESRKYALSRGFNSAVSFLLCKVGNKIYNLNLFSVTAMTFRWDEIELLRQTVNDIAFALNVFEKDKQKALAEERLRHSELRLNQAQAMAHIGSWELDFNTKCAIWSPEACNIYGVNRNNNVHSFESWLSFVHPDDRERVVAISEAGQRSLNSYEFYYRIVRAEGAVRLVFAQSRFELDENGVPISFCGAVHDVTEAKAAEEALIDANRLYAFSSGISQAVVHVTGEQTLFNETCRIAVDTGKFEFAWVGAIDAAHNRVNIVAECNAKAEDRNFFMNLEYPDNGPTAYLLRGHSYYITNNFEHECDGQWKMFARDRGFKSAISLLVKKAGRPAYVFYLYSNKVEFFNSGEVTLLHEAADNLSFAIDVLEKERIRVQVENKLKHDELHLKQAQSIAQFGSWELDFATGMAAWSEEACRIYGLSPHDNIQSYDTWVSFIHPDDLDYVMGVTKEQQATLSSGSFYHRIVRSDGSVRHIHSQSHFEFNDKGGPVGLYGVSHDVTEIKAAEDALRQSKENIGLIVNLIPQPIFAKDIDGKYVFVNKSFADLHGLSPEELIDKSMRQTIPVKADMERFLRQDQEVIDSGETKVIPDDVFTDSKGNKRIFHTIKVPFTVAGTNTKAVLGVTRDITVQKNAEAERARMVDDIVQRNKDLEQFSYIVSHNLRAPVANIIGLTDLMNIFDSSEADKKIMMQELSVSAGRLDTVIKDLNHILQVKHQVTENRVFVPFEALIKDIKLSINQLLKNEDASIVTDFTAVDGISTLKSYMYSIFFNLISNSIKYRQQDVKPVIEIKSSKKENCVELTFRDNGIGIDLDRKGEQVFGLYKRFHFHTEGKGMGLYMVKTQVESLGGKIQIDSEVNKGTIFRITFENN